MSLLVVLLRGKMFWDSGEGRKLSRGVNCEFDFKKLISGKVVGDLTCVRLCGKIELRR